ncbi:MAG: acyl-CoA thioesterase [Acidimicrobiales bacterium]
MDTTTTTTFAQQMASVTADVVPGRYTADVSAAWNCPIVPQGGLMSAVAAQAMGQEIATTGSRDGGTHADEMVLRSLTTVYAAAVPAGVVTIDVRTLRRGRSMAQLMATVRTPGASAGHTSLAVFGRRRAGFEFTDLAMPVVAPPEECPSFRDPLPEGVEPDRAPFAFWNLVEGRPAMGHAPWEDYEPTSSDSALWYRMDPQPLRADGTLDPLALVVYGDTMPGAVGERLGPNQPDWAPPSCDLTVHLLGQPRSEWILGHSRARRAVDGYASLEMALWDPAVGLVAHSSQIMYFVFPNGDGPPPS